MRNEYYIDKELIIGGLDIAYLKLQEKPTASLFKLVFDEKNNFVKKVEVKLSIVEVEI